MASSTTGRVLCPDPVAFGAGRFWGDTGEDLCEVPEPCLQEVAEDHQCPGQQQGGSWNAGHAWSWSAWQNSAYSDNRTSWWSYWLDSESTAWRTQAHKSLWSLEQDETTAFSAAPPQLDETCREEEQSNESIEASRNSMDSEAASTIEEEFAYQVAEASTTAGSIEQLNHRGKLAGTEKQDALPRRMRLDAEAAKRMLRFHVMEAGNSSPTAAKLPTRAASGDLWATYRSGQPFEATGTTALGSSSRSTFGEATWSWKGPTAGRAALTNGPPIDKAVIQMNKDLIAKWSARDILETVGEHMEEFDIINAVTALHRVAKSTDKSEAKRDWWLSRTLARLIDQVVEFVTDTRALVEAKEVTKTAWALAKMCLAEVPTMDALAEQAVRKVHDMDGQGLSNSVWGFATARIWHGRLFTVIVAESKKQLADFEPQGLSNTAWALAKISWVDYPLMAMLADETARRTPDFDPQGLANIGWAFATLGFRSQVMMDAIAEELIVGIGRWSHQNIANFVWAFAKLGMQHPRMLDAIALETMQTIQDWNPQGLANVSWAFAKIGVNNQRFYDEVERECLHQIRDFQPQNLVNIAWAYAKMALRKPRLFAGLAEGMLWQAPDFNPQHCSNAVWAFGTLSIVDFPVLDAIAETVNDTASQFCAQDLANIAWAFAKMARRDEDLMDTVAVEVARKVTTFQAQNLSITAYSFSQVGIENIRMMDAIAAEALGRMTEFDGQGLSNLAQSYAKLAMQRDDVFKAIGAEARCKISTFTNQELAMFAWSFSKLNHFEDEPLRTVTEETRSRIRELTPQDLSVLIWAYARGGGRNKDVLETLAWEVMNHLRQLIPQDLSTVSWGYATAAVENSKMMAAVAEECLVKIGHFSMQDLANTAWGFAKLGILHEELMVALAREVTSRIAECQAQHLSITSWAFAKLGMAHRPLLTKVARAASQRASEFDAQGVGNIIWAYGVLGHKDLELVTAVSCRAEAVLTQLTAQEAANIAFGLQALEQPAQLRRFLERVAPHFRRSAGPSDGASWADFANVARSIGGSEGGFRGMAEVDEAFRKQCFNPTLQGLRDLKSGKISIADALAELQLILDGNGLPYLGEHYTLDALVDLEFIERDRHPAFETWLSAARRRCREAAGGSWRIPATDTILAFVAWKVHYRDVDLVDDGRVFHAVRHDDAGSASVGDFLRPLRQHIRRDSHPERAALIEFLDAAGRSNSSNGDLRDYQGMVRIYVSQYPCISCLGVFCQFQRRCPNIRLQVAFDNAWATFCGQPRFALG